MFFLIFFLKNSTFKKKITNAKIANMPRYLNCLSFENILGGLVLWNKSQDHGEEPRLHYHKHLVHLLRKILAFCNMPHSLLS
jgi:hypothetical protein